MAERQEREIIDKLGDTCTKALVNPYNWAVNLWESERHVLFFFKDYVKVKKRMYDI